MEGVLRLNILCDKIIKLLGKLYKHIHASHTSILISINVNVTCHVPFPKVISISHYGDVGLPFTNTLALWARTNRPPFFVLLHYKQVIIVCYFMLK